jgi:hypothetical protein
VSCLEGTHSGRLLFSGGADGLLMAHDLRMKEASRVLWHHNAGVNGLALEDPWLVSAASGVLCRVGTACCPARHILIGQAQLASACGMQPLLLHAVLCWVRPCCAMLDTSCTLCCMQTVL